MKKIGTLYNLSIEFIGEVAEWSNAPVLKTDVPKGTQGSNPCLSAIIYEPQYIRLQGHYSHIKWEWKCK